MGFRQRVADICATLPGATVGEPWDSRHLDWDYRGQTFAFVSGFATDVMVRCPDEEHAARLIAAGLADRPVSGKAGWVSLPSETDDATLERLLRASYDLVREADAAGRRLPPLY